MQGFTRDYKGIEGITRVYKDLQGITRDNAGFQIKDYRKLQGYTWVWIYKGMERFTWVCKDIQGFTEVIQGITGLYKGFTGHGKVYMGLQGYARVCRGYTRVYNGLQYTCQLFLRYKRNIFILGMLGFLKTARSFPKILEEVFRRGPKSSEDLRSLRTRKNASSLPVLFNSEIRDREEGIVTHLFILRVVFVPYMGLS